MNRSRDRNLPRGNKLALAHAAAKPAAVLQLEPSTPFRLDLTAWTLRRRPDNRIDRWDGRSYGRTLVIGGKALEVAVTQVGTIAAPRLEVTGIGRAIAPADAPAVASTIERLLGVRADLAGFHRLAARDPRLAPLAARFRGMRPPRYPTVFEALANAVACQQVTLTLGITLLNRLTARYGAAPAGEAESDRRAFPSPVAMAGADADELRSLGFSRQKAAALIGLGEATAGGRLDETLLQELDDDAALAQLRDLRGGADRARRGDGWGPC